MIILTIALLILMEISLSFDNAVLNAGVLRKMYWRWQQRFITWGLPIAVFGMRLVFPIVIVSIASHISMAEVLDMALHEPEAYGRALSGSHIVISCFGGLFLLMVFLDFVLDATKEVHWLGVIERHLSAAGMLKGIEIVVAGSVLVTLQHFVPEAQKISALLAGMSGIGLYITLKAVMGLFEGESIQGRTGSGLASFLYLEILDASCSFDGVIGAFVLTNNIILIMIGLGIGALCIRSLTLYLVRGGVLKEFIYLEHGAHWGIGALAVIMLVDVVHAVPEPITGLIGISFIGLSLLSSQSRRTV